VRAVSPASVRGVAVRAARHRHGIQVGAAARALQMPVSSLIAVEVGTSEFVEPGDYLRVVEALDAAGKRKAQL
jgi:hypothetical protein